MTWKEAIKYCEDWWHTYIETGISPPFDEKKDKEYLSEFANQIIEEMNKLIEGDNIK